MVSCFICRELGLGLGNFTQEQIDAVNTFRHGKSYTIERCTEVLGMAHNKEESPIDSDPAIEFFNYGKNNQGYWPSENMAIQFEDVCDCLKALEATKNIHFIFMFDHSSGHAKAQDDGLKASNLGVGYGGNQTKIRNTIIEDGCLDTQPDCTVKVGDTYCLSFRTVCTKPMHMLSEEQDYHENETAQ